MSYRKADIYVHETKAGVLEETETGYRFQYESEYLSQKDADAVSLTLPIRKDPYESQVLFPFFDGLIPEGWLLDVVEDTWKVNPKDRMGILLVSCRDTIGNVSVREA
ncbi:phosphatidylinositol kinase [Rhodohalobacter sp. SW132]|uniref:HipA N-terminal domain-containing protein n=1 Tax=Rhodohalobacter sp. SW132 TaxID=2293433 RepID=UPI000E25AFD6|nr:HipA N-terminal domain-containing protein [Rhodohalobacter sp. SW132]REL24826.1 phosphatidylinositol kinase [Rhodohalobacter sp. SW132]